MKQDDYFLKQIDILGKVLGRIFSNLLKLKNKGEREDIIEITNQELKKELDINLNEILQFDSEKFLKFLQNDKQFDIVHLEKMAEILYVLGFNQISDNRSNILEKCLKIYVFVSNSSKTYSVERFNRIEEINNILN